MSNGEAKRWYLYTENEALYAVSKNQRGFVPDASTIEVMSVEDHERIVAELKAELDERTEQLETTMERYRAPAMTIASQKRVIDRFRQSINDLIIYVDSDADSFGDRYWQTRNTLISMLKETTAIEKGEA